MASLIYLDTHVVAWLYAGELDLFPYPVRTILESSQLVVSPMAELELEFLHEVGRATEPGDRVVSALEEEIGLTRCGLPFAQVVGAAMHENWTRDPFDRLIVAQARARRLPLLTKDRSIRDHYSQAVWFD